MLVLGVLLATCLCNWLWTILNLWLVSLSRLVVSANCWLRLGVSLLGTAFPQWTLRLNRVYVRRSMAWTRTRVSEICIFVGAGLPAYDGLSVIRRRWSVQLNWFVSVARSFRLRLSMMGNRLVTSFVIVVILLSMQASICMLTRLAMLCNGLVQWGCLVLEWAAPRVNEVMFPLCVVTPRQLTLVLLSIARS